MITRLAKRGRGPLFALAVIHIVLSGIWLSANVGELRDYGSFIAAGKAVENGDNPYGSYEETFRPYYAEKVMESPNLNPPISIYPFTLLAKFDAYNGKLVLNIISIVLFGAVVWMLLRAYPQYRTQGMYLWLLSLTGIWHIIELGQIYLPMILAVTYVWFHQERRPFLSGVLLGLCIAMKPNFVAWPLLLLLTGERKTSLGALSTAAVLSAIPLALEGPGIYRQWIDASQAFNGLEAPGNSALLAVFARAGLEPLGVAASAGLIGGFALWAWRFRPSARRMASGGILATLLLGPITWSAYALFALPLLLEREWHGWERAAAFSFVIPIWVVLLTMPTNAVTWFVFGGAYAWGLLILFALFAGDEYRRLRPVSLPVVVLPVEESAAAAA